MLVAENIQKLRSALPTGVTLIAVSKTKPAEDIQEAYNAGQRDFGENKVQEMAAKYEVLPKDIRWHQIGHLQTNKIKYLAKFVHLIHSVDSLKLLKEINKEAIKNQRVIPCLLQVHIAQEETKFGFSKEELVEALRSEDFKSLLNVRIDGLMGMATFTENEDTVRREFLYLKNLFEEIKASFFPISVHFKELSMGMSSDYKIAIEAGSTMVRIGSFIFGERIYSINQ